MTDLHLSQLPPLSLYIHLPWCVKKCPYCDFNSHTLKDTLPEQEYITALITDLDQALPLVWGRPIQSIFIGGGTPSLFSGASIDYLLSQIRARLRLLPEAEITLEANPGTVEQHYIHDYAASGVNRISLGIQSFNQQHLQRLGRIHNQAEAIHAIENVATHFNNFNLDLMYGLPEQTLSELIADFELAISFQPTHISAYNLTIEPNTAFAKHIPQNLPDDDLCYAMQDQLINLLASAGYHRYEISAYAKPSYQAQHNLNYWQFGDYLGIGAGAHSKLSFHDRIMRQIRQKHPQHYLQQVKHGQHLVENKQVSSHELPFEFMLNALRLTDGFDLKLYTQTTGLALSTILPQLLQAADNGFIQLPSTRVTPTAKGRDFLNNLLELFLNEAQ